MVAAFATCHSLVHLVAGDDNDPPEAKDLTLSSKPAPGAAAAATEPELPFAGDPMEVELFKMIGEYIEECMCVCSCVCVCSGVRVCV